MLNHQFLINMRVVSITLQMIKGTFVAVKGTNPAHGPAAGPILARSRAFSGPTRLYQSRWHFPPPGAAVTRGQGRGAREGVRRANASQPGRLCGPEIVRQRRASLTDETSSRGRGMPAVRNLRNVGFESGCFRTFAQ